MKLTRPKGPGEHWVAADRRGGVEVRFAGLGPGTGRTETLAAVGGGGLELAWCRQIHSDRAVEARPGECGEADALITERPGLALVVATADCVPVVIADGRRLAVIHAGWRGIAAAIVPKTLDRMGDLSRARAWLGPAIGPCCYEVGPVVADEVVAASGPEALTPGRSDRPHLDLHRAVALQLEPRGLEAIRRVEACTYCRSDALSSYRRLGSRAGRNLTFAWLAS